MPEFIHNGEDKKKFVQQIFDDIAHRYDFLNHFLSLGIDIYWRKKFIRKLNIADQTTILDVACGTGDICFEILKFHNVSVIGLDISKNMINLAKKKAEKRKQSQATFIHGDGESLPLDSDSIDYLTISYGFRNISNYEVALEEFFRVLKPGGKLGILEFSKPKSKIIRSVFGLYFHHILPRIGSLFSRSDAYRYLPESVDFFPTRHDINKQIIFSGFKRVENHDLTFGISTIFLAFKSDE